MSTGAMKFSDETLMAYADGELDPATRSAIETAMADDAQIAAVIARHQQMQAGLRAAFGCVLDETVPDRLIAAAHTAPAAATVTPLESTRTTHAPRRHWSWPEWGAMAASLLLGIVVARMFWSANTDDEFIAKNGRVIAGGELAAALNNRASGATAGNSPVHISLSYRDKSGDYCRTFAIEGSEQVSGIACHQNDAWRVQALVRGKNAESGTHYRMAGTAVPPIILQTVQDSIQGDALDAEEESALRQRGWKQDR